MLFLTSYLRKLRLSCRKNLKFVLDLETRLNLSNLCLCFLFIHDSISKSAKSNSVVRSPAENTLYLRDVVNGLTWFLSPLVK
jgi:hypothetical protein